MITWVQDEPRPDTPEELAYRAGEAQRKAECADARGHVWWLELEHPEDGSGISLSCEHCPAGFDDLYPDGVDAVNADVAGVEIAAGCHNSPVPLLIPVDCEVLTTHTSNPIVGEDWDVEFTVAARGPSRPVIWPPNQSNDNERARTDVTKFEVGDQVHMPGVPFVLTVLEIGTCEDGDKCEMGMETFRFADPEGKGDDWMHSSQFERVAG